MPLALECCEKASTPDHWFCAKGPVCDATVYTYDVYTVTVSPSLLWSRLPRSSIRARNFDVDKASAMLQTTLDWRRDFGVQKILDGGCMDVVRRENATGKVKKTVTD